MVYVEAMSFGLPVITTDSIPGSREIFGNNEYGIIIQENNSRQMAEAIVKLYSDDTLYESLALKGLSRCKMFDEKNIEKQLIEHLQYIVKS